MPSRMKAHLMWLMGMCLLLLGVGVPTLAVDPPGTQDPTIVVTKEGTPEPVAIGGIVTYTITITNTGSTVLKNIKVDDPLLGGDITSAFFSGAASLPKTAPDNTVSATFDVPVNIFDVECDPDTHEYSLENTVTVTGKRGSDKVYNTATEEIDVLPPLLVTKTPDYPISKVGDEIVYTITIQNTTEDVILEDITVTDPLFADQYPGGDITSLFEVSDGVDALVDGLILEPGDTATATLTYPVTEDDPNIVDDEIINTVTVTAKPEIEISTSEVSDFTIIAQASATVEIVHPAITITKVPNVGSAGVGKTVIYTITITNTGDVDLRNVRVVDKINGTDKTINLTKYFFPDGEERVLEEGKSISIQFPYVVQSTDPSPLIDTVTVHANPIFLENDITDSAKACVKRCSAAGGTEPAQQFLPDMILYTANYVYAGGDNIYNTTGKNQTLNVTIAKGSKLVLPLRVENDELIAEIETITATTGAGKPALWKIQYFNAFNKGAGGGDITSKVTGAGWNPNGTGKMKANGACDFAIGITPTGSTLKSGDKITILVSANINGDTDTVKIIATVK